MIGYRVPAIQRQDKNIAGLLLDVQMTHQVRLQRRGWETGGTINGRDTLMGFRVRAQDSEYWHTIPCVRTSQSSRYKYRLID